MYQGNIISIDQDLKQLELMTLNTIFTTTYEGIYISS